MIRLKKILIPTDLSEYARHVLPYAVEFARSYDAKIFLVHVVDAHWAGPVASAEFPGMVENQIEANKESAQTTMEQMRAELVDAEVETRVLVGAPHVEVVRFARSEDIDLITLATHGRTGLAHALIGSVAEKVVQMAPCPVLTIKHPEHEFVLP
ncbi:MAG: nucleotide-binding universal stress UspA family protein [Candidatus Latescibacterota bacterium]|jgi:nucleotide-binding universal stress UspA family protein